MENLLVAITNLPAFLPISLSIRRGDYLTASTIIIVSVGSFVSHLLENHKHGMPGIIDVSPRVSYIWNRIDVAGVAIVLARFAYLFYNRGWTIYKFVQEHPYIVQFLFWSVFLNLVSEYDKYNPELKKLYIVCHMMWHVSIFILMYWVLSILYH